MLNSKLRQLRARDLNLQFDRHDKRFSLFAGPRNQPFRTARFPKGTGFFLVTLACEVEQFCEVKHDRPVVVVLSVEEFERLKALEVSAPVPGTPIPGSSSFCSHLPQNAWISLEPLLSRSQMKNRLFVFGPDDLNRLTQ